MLKSGEKEHRSCIISANEFLSTATTTKKSLDKLGGKYHSDEKFLTPLSTENLFHEVWLHGSLSATKTAQNQR